MNSEELKSQQGEVPLGVLEQPIGAAMNSRRRLFRQGVSVAAVTLASRPVLAWHCKTTSAWGSELVNPTTSLKTGKAHPLYPDEAWYIVDWANNSNTNSAMGAVGKPWDVLVTKYPAIVNSKTTTNGAFDYTKVKVTTLVNVIGSANLQIPAGVNTTATVKNVFLTGSNFATAVFAAQLNFILLWQRPDPFQQEKCTSLAQLNTMAGGSYTPANAIKPWSTTDIYNYLTQNYIVR